MKNYQLMADLLIPTGLKIAELQRDSLGVWLVDTASGMRLVLVATRSVKRLGALALVWKSGPQSTDKQY